jgi:hypothetical protein
MPWAALLWVGEGEGTGVRWGMGPETCSKDGAGTGTGVEAWEEAWEEIIAWWLIA